MSIWSLIAKIGWEKMPEINVGINASGAVRGAKRVNAALGSVGSKASSIVKTAFNPLNAAIGAVVSAATITGLAKVSDKYTVMASQLEYVTGSAAEAEEVQKALYEISRQTGTQMEENAGTMVKLQQASEMTHLTQAENLKVIKGLNALMIKTGTSGQQASNAMLQLSQALTSGKLAGDEFRSMAENAPGVLNEMAKQMGYARSELKQMAADGELTSEKMGVALLKIAEDAESSMDELPETVGQGWNAVVLAFERAWDIINDDTGIMGYFREALINLADWIVEMTPTFSLWIENLVDAVENNWPSIKQFFVDMWGMFNKTVEFIQTNRGSFVAWANGIMVVGRAIISFMRPVLAFIMDVIEQTTRAIAGLAALAGHVSTGRLAGAGEAFREGYETPLSAANEQFGGGATTINNNFNASYGTSDVAKITTEQTRQEAQY